MDNKACYVEFNSGLYVNLIKIQKNQEEDTLNSYANAIKDDIREKVNTNTVLFTSFGDVSGINSQSKSVEAYYFDSNNTISDATISIFRKTPQQRYYDFICTLDNKGFSMQDYNILNDHYYHYMASALVDTHIEPRPNTDDLPRVRYYVYENKDDKGNEIYIHTIFDSWSICDLEETDEENIYQVTGNTWSLGLNIEGESITQNVGISSWDTLGRYSKQAYGQKNYASSQFTGLLGQIKEYDKYILPEKSVYIDNPSSLYDKYTVYQYTERNNINNSHALDTEKLEGWLDFITNGKLKLLKDVKGNGWIIQVVDTNSYEINNQSSYKQTTISFQWKEVENINKCSIIGLK